MNKQNIDISVDKPDNQNHKLQYRCKAVYRLELKYSYILPFRFEMPSAMMTS